MAFEQSTRTNVSLVLLVTSNRVMQTQSNEVKGQHHVRLTEL